MSDFNCTFEFPIRLPSKANLREHWRKSAARTKKHRETTRLVTLGHARPAIALAKAALAAQFKVTVSFCRIAKQQLDDDNLRSALKAVRDEMADLLGLKNDRDPRVEWVYSERKALNARTHQLEISISGPSLARGAA